jgi:RNA-directed DNA polymerase
MLTLCAAWLLPMRCPLQSLRIYIYCALGSGVSPVLANVYLHYVLDDWFTKVVVKWSKGSTSVIRYTDDFVCCFDYREDAERFYRTLPKRFAKFGLEPAEEKTRILQFGIYAAKGEKEPETFNFLGFTFYCGMNQRGTMSIIKVKSDRKKIASKLKKLNLWLKENRTLPVKELIMRIDRSLVGHFHYYGVTGNGNSIKGKAIRGAHSIMDSCRLFLWLCLKFM